MKRSEQKQLLKDIFAERDLSQVREISHQSGLTSLGKRRRIRRVRQTLLFALPLVLGLGALIDISVRRPSQGGNEPASPKTIRPQNPEVKVINDDELFACFPNHSLALVGKPGHQDLVFLDHGRWAVIETR